MATRRSEATNHVLPFPQSPDGIELRHLRAFVAVAEELNFSRAAERLCVSQPALSRQIRALEQLVGAQLLTRSTHKVALTLAGGALLDRSRKLLADVDDAVATTMAVGGELAARTARLLGPLAALTPGDVQRARDAAEDLNAHFSPPPGIVVRPVTAGGVPSLFVAQDPASPPTVLYLHGGAYVLGSAFGYQAHAGALAASAQTGVLAPDYRLAPEHPFPAAVDDAISAYRWLLSRGLSAADLAVAGDSSGGGLALSMLIRLRQEGLPMPGAAVLLCPLVDLFLHRTSGSGNQPQPLAGADVARYFAEAYLAGHPPDDPIIDPLSADLSGLPRMLIESATGDPRVDESKGLAARARSHGVDVRLELYPVAAHAFQLFWSFLPEAADAMESAGAFLRNARFVGSAESSLTS
jgi:monoterpene epsilon-lactone hydrolase